MVPEDNSSYHIYGLFEGYLLISLIELFVTWTPFISHYVLFGMQYRYIDFLLVHSLYVPP